MQVNKILPFSADFLHVSISWQQVNDISQEICTRGQVTGFNMVLWAVKALTLTDLTTLAGDDTASNVSRLCRFAAYPLPTYLMQKAIEPALHDQIHTAAVCVYPACVADAYNTLKQLDCINKITIAAVAAGFPSGQYGLKSRLDEITFAIEQGAREIDIVINRQLAVLGKWRELYEEVCEMRKVCGQAARLKAILATGELYTMENVYKAAMVCMMAGVDFIKTSTGKEAVNATIPIGLVMIWAIQNFYCKTKGVKVGLKPAGGIRTVHDAITWMILVKETLGKEWLQPSLFRFGASGLVDDLIQTINNGLSKASQGQQIL